MGGAGPSRSPGHDALSEVVAQTVLQPFFATVGEVIEPDAARRKLMTTSSRIDNAIRQYISSKGGDFAQFLADAAGVQDHEQLVELFLAATGPASRKRTAAVLEHTDQAADTMQAPPAKAPRLDGPAWTLKCQEIEFLDGLDREGRAPCAVHRYYGNCRRSSCDRSHSLHAGLYGSISQEGIDESISRMEQRFGTEFGQDRFGWSRREPEAEEEEYYEEEDHEEEEQQQQEEEEEEEEEDQ